MCSFSKWTFAHIRTYFVFHSIQQHRCVRHFIWQPSLKPRSWLAGSCFLSPVPASPHLLVLSSPPQGLEARIGRFGKVWLPRHHTMGIFSRSSFHSPHPGRFYFNLGHMFQTSKVQKVTHLDNPSHTSFSLSSYPQQVAIIHSFLVILLDCFMDTFYLLGTFYTLGSILYTDVWGVSLYFSLCFSHVDSWKSLQSFFFFKQLKDVPCMDLPQWITVVDY